MLSLKVRISENASEEEKRKLKIKREDLSKFMEYGYGKNKYEAEVVYFFQARAFSPDVIQIFIDCGEALVYAGGAVAAVKELKGLAVSIYKLFKKTKGYKAEIILTAGDEQVWAFDVNAKDIQKTIADLEKELTDKLNKNNPTTKN